MRPAGGITQLPGDFLLQHPLQRAYTAARLVSCRQRSGPNGPGGSPGFGGLLLVTCHFRAVRSEGGIVHLFQHHAEGVQLHVVLFAASVHVIYLGLLLHLVIDPPLANLVGQVLLPKLLQPATQLLAGASG